MDTRSATLPLPRYSTTPQASLPPHNTAWIYPAILLQMAFQDALTFCTWESCLDTLAAGSGLSQGMINNFRSKKEYKNCPRLYRGAQVAIWIPFLYVCFEEGVLLCSDAFMENFGIFPQSEGSDQISLPSLTNLVQAAALEEGPLSAEFENALQCNPLYFGASL
eukprot:IDg16320t1